MRKKKKRGLVESKKGGKNTPKEDGWGGSECDLGRKKKTKKGVKRKK